MTVENYIDRIKERAYTIAYNNIKDCQRNYRIVFLQAIVDNIINVSYNFRDELRTDFIDVFETDENFEPVEDTVELMDKLREVFNELDNSVISNIITLPLYKELWGIDLGEDIKKY